MRKVNSEYNVSPQNITVVIVDDYEPLRVMLRRIIENEKDMRIIAEATDGVEAIQLVREVSPDVMIMDINMPKMDGIMATKEITMREEKVQIIGLSLHEDESVRNEMLNAGAIDFISKSDIKDLCPTIRKVAREDFAA